METNKKQPSETQQEPQILEGQLGLGKLDQKPQPSNPENGTKAEASNNPAEQDSTDDITAEWQDPETQIMG